MKLISSMTSRSIIVFFAVVFLFGSAAAQNPKADSSKAIVANLLINEFFIDSTPNVVLTPHTSVTMVRIGKPSKVAFYSDRMTIGFANDFRTLYYKSSIYCYYGWVDFGLLRLSPNYKYSSNEKKREELDQERSNLCNILCGNLTYLRNQYFDSLLKDFSSLAEEYKKTDAKPQITEEQRKYIVQANAFAEEKNYSRAIETFNKVLAINPTSYPAAYYNLAFIYGQITDYSVAIFNMKKYLMLATEAEDARKGQDQIYIWESKLGQ
jgi:tetratricopeptide (TPR) repeat protein